MKLNKPKFWDREKSLFSKFLLPLSFITQIIIWIKDKVIKPHSFNITIICIGNIYIGGTGKTPLSIFIANELKKNKKNPVIIKKFYKLHKDEHELIQNEYKNLILNKSRSQAINEAIDRKFNVAILDDGFQDNTIFKNLSIICFNQKQLIGNGLVIPAGPLRENLSSLKKANIVIINGKRNKQFENKILDFNKSLSIFYSNYEPLNIDRFLSKKIVAIAGIGNPTNFFNLLEDFKVNVVEKHEFPDHYEFSKSELTSIMENAKKNDYQILMTEKDYFRVKKFKLEDLDYLKVVLKINEKEKLIKKILENI